MISDPSSLNPPCHNDGFCFLPFLVFFFPKGFCPLSFESFIDGSESRLSRLHKNMLISPFLGFTFLFFWTPFPPLGSRRAFNDFFPFAEKVYPIAVPRGSFRRPLFDPTPSSPSYPPPPPFEPRNVKRAGKLQSILFRRP